MSDTPPFLLAGLAEALDRMRVEAATGLGVRPEPRQAGGLGPLPQPEAPVRLGRRPADAVAAAPAAAMDPLPLEAEALRRTGLAMLEARLAAGGAETPRAAARPVTAPAAAEARPSIVRVEPVVPAAVKAPALAAPSRPAETESRKRGIWPFRR